MEAWVRIEEPVEEDTNAFILIKGTYDEGVSAAFVKGYAIRYDYKDEKLIGSVYTSLGVLRSVEGPGLAFDTWFHIAVVYDGLSLILYANSRERARAVFDTPRPLHHNPYYHPVSVGPGLYGVVDEVRIWAKSLTQPEIFDLFFCPPPADMDGVLLYLPFNAAYESGTQTEGFSQWCTPDSLEGMQMTCLHVEIIQQRVGGGGLNDTNTTGTRRIPDTPMTGDGVAHLAKSRSFVVDVQPEVSTDLYPSLMKVMARDVCNYAYTKSKNELFELELERYRWNYFSPDPPHNPHPVRERLGGKLTALSTVQPGTCTVPNFPRMPYRKGDEHNFVYPFVMAGLYEFEVNANDDSIDSIEAKGLLQEFADRGPGSLLVVAGTPVRVELEGLDRPFVAGQPGVVYGTAFDQYDNQLMEEFPIFVEITMVGENWTVTPEPAVTFDKLTGCYSIAFTAPHSPVSGAYTFIVTARNPDIHLSTLPAIPSFRPQPSPWRRVLVDGDITPTAAHRFEHSSVTYKGDIYIFGGALFDKSYLNSLAVLENADGCAGKDAFAYVKTIELNSSMPYHGAPVVELIVNTQELVLAGRLTKHCTDILFKAPSNGPPLEFYVDPYPGCNSTETRIYVRLPEGILADGGPESITMAYGNAYVTGNSYHAPKLLFEFYDGFEEPELDSRWSPVASCSMEPLPEPVHTLNTSFAYSGHGSLYVRDAQRGGLLARLPRELDRFHLRAWLWDSDYNVSAHFISSDFESCGATANRDPTFSRPNNLFSRVAVMGMYTKSSVLKYCVGAPWQSVPPQAPKRAAQWRRLDVWSSPETGMSAAVDGVTVKTAPPINASRVVISAGLSVDIPIGANIAGGHAHWDDIVLATWYPHIHSRVAGIEEDEMVDVVESRSWHMVNTSGTHPPPPRYSHTAVVSGDKMWVFGGERSSYAFNDLWSFDFATSTWSHVLPRGIEFPAPRYDHSAAVVVHPDGEECMVVLGGRDGETIFSDMWEFCFSSSTWTLLAGSTAAGKRFGHAAAAPSGSSVMYLFGGYVERDFQARSGGVFQEGSFSRGFFRCNASECIELTYGCREALFMGNTADAIGIAPRYGHTLHATPNGVALVLYGGSNLDAKDGLTGIFRYDIDACNWEKLEMDGEDQSRYEHAVGISHGGIIVQGGHSAGTYMNDLNFFPVQ
uniref:Member of the kelch motif protein family n=1 Tax=Tetraselmis sp. GSL018 TaxID=582737 RepID=A0A061SBI8_9CHLO